MVKAPGAAAIGLFLACWAAFFLQVFGVVRLPALPRLTLTALYGIASALGWLAGAVYVQSTRRLAGRARRPFFLLSFWGPPGLVFLLVALGRLQQQAPLVLLWALAVFAIFYLVPVSFRSVGRGPRP